MCGIVGYIGSRNATPILLSGLSELEFRGYDSAGIYVRGAGCLKAVGAPDTLAAKVPETFTGTIGIAHNRWSTHGAPSEANAHPHHDCTGSLWLVHNGKIDNFAELKDGLLARGHTFTSETDSEVIVHLIEEGVRDGHAVEVALTKALSQVRGTYGVVLAVDGNHDQLFTASMGSPIAIGIGQGEAVIASHPAAIIRHTRDVLFLRDGECATVTLEGPRIYTLDHAARVRRPEVMEGSTESVQKDGHPHFMMKEIMEIPRVLVDSARGRLVPEEGGVKLGGLEDVRGELLGIKRLLVVGCGSAYYAGQIGKRMIEECAGIPVDVELGSEFRFRHLALREDTAVIAVSQSGETIDTLLPVREAKQKGLLTLGIVNQVGSAIARETEAGVYCHAGFEKSVASTKAFVSQLEIFALLALFLGRQRGLSFPAGQDIVRELLLLPDKVRTVLDKREAVANIARHFIEAKGFLYLGKAHSLPVAQEGALKLKEVVYLPAEGYASGEMKHGPLALIDGKEKFAAVIVAPDDGAYERNTSAAREIVTRGGEVFAIVAEGDTEMTSIAQHVIEVPKTIDMLSPFLTVVPLQLFAYYLGVARGLNVDMPRHLAKSVTVE